MEPEGVDVDPADAEVVLEFEPAGAAVGVQAGAAVPTLAMSAIAWAKRAFGNGAIPAGKSP